MCVVSQKPQLHMYTVISHENGTITGFSPTVSATELATVRPWVPLNGIHTNSIPAERFVEL